jgi:hypothetical protein
MKIAIAGIVLAGLLVSEFRDFFTNGGLQNVIAYNLFKIFCIFIFLITFGVYFTISYCQNMPNLDQPEKVEKENGETDVKAFTKKRRPSKSPHRLHKVKSVLSD